MRGNRNSDTVIPLWGLNQEGKSSVVTAQRHLNLYAEIQREEEKAKVVFFGTAGLDLFSSENGDTPIRGWIVVNNLFYFVHRGTLYSANNAAVRTSLGTLNTTAGEVCMAYNGTLILIVDGVNLYTYTLASTTFAQVTGMFVPDGANTCAWLDSQFIVDDGVSDEFFISPTGTGWDAADFATAESNPDGLVRVFVDNGEIILGGTSTIEYWGNTGATDFPFSPIKGATVEVGLAARWSMTKFNSGVAFLGTPASAGKFQVYFIQGYVPRPISSPEVDYIINNYPDVADAVAFSYLLGGHPMLQINFPSANASWLYDASTGLWSPLEYGLEGNRHRGQLQLNFLTRTLISDYSNGNIYTLNPTAYTDNGTPIAREIVSRHVFHADDRVVIDELYVDMETGIGLTGNSDSSGTNYLNLPGAAGDYASTPDSVALDITGDIDIRALIDPADWTPSATSTIVAKAINAGSQISYFLILLSTGQLQGIWSANGSTLVSALSNAIVPGVIGTPLWVKWTLDVNDGLGNNVSKFYTSSDGISYTQLGVTIVNAGITSIFVSTAILEIGSRETGTANPFSGKIYRAQVYSGIAGTLVANFNATHIAAGLTSFSGIGTGELYTVNGAASIAGTYVQATQGANPQAMLQISKNNGRTWGAILTKSMGAIGKYVERVVWRRLGVARDWTFKIRVTDPVPITFTFAAIRPRQ